MHVLDDPELSRRLGRFLAGRARGGTRMSESEIRATASVQVDQRREPAPEPLVAAMVRFERRYGGLTYPLLTGNPMEYSLSLDGYPTGHHSEFGLAFPGVLDGDWTWQVDVLLDGRTAMGPGRWSYRVIDRSIEQRLEKHALLDDVREWPHRTVECVTPPGLQPVVHAGSLAPPVPGASGPADLWWADDTTAIHATLQSWPPDQDRWLLYCFADTTEQLSHVARAFQAAVEQPITPAAWCGLCITGLDPEQVCNS